MKTYKKGDNHKDKGNDLKTYGITEIDPEAFGCTPDHANKIEVYGDIELRNRIIKLLNKSNLDLEEK
jgi:hypothetical protein